VEDFKKICGLVDSVRLFLRNVSADFELFTD